MNIKIIIYAILLLNLNCNAAEISDDARKQIAGLNPKLASVSYEKLAEHAILTSPKSTWKITVMCYNTDFDEACKLRSVNLNIAKSTTVAQLKVLIAQEQNCSANDIVIFTTETYIAGFALADTKTIQEIQSKDRSSILAFNKKGQFPK